MATYVVRCTNWLAGDATQYCTVTLVGAEANVVKYLHKNVEDAGGGPMEATMEAYLQNVREYMEENGGTAIWDIHCNGEELECFKNGYMWADEWDVAEENGGCYYAATISVYKNGYRKHI